MLKKMIEISKRKAKLEEERKNRGLPFLMMIKISKRKLKEKSAEET